MSMTAAILLLVSAAVHATWNLLGKRGNPSAAFMLVANTLGCLFLFPVFVLPGNPLAGFSAPVWGYLVLTGACQALYYIGLAYAYQSGDLSLAYPLARSTPVLMVAALTAWFGWGAPLSSRAILGMSLIVTGCLILPVQDFSAFRWGNYWNRACLFALVAALGTTGYSIVDSEALRLVHQVAGQSAASTAAYAFFEGLASSFWLALFVLGRKPDRQALQHFGRADTRLAAVVGLAIYLAYTFVLVAMGFVTNVSYVVAFRQISIVIGAVLGVMLLHEPRYANKFIGIAIAFVGLILVGSG
jgi:drug/metabolite transporter (DMT)-like permease